MSFLPSVSVVIPTFNRLDTIERAIDSVLNQTYGNVEIIVVDDNSSDGTKLFLQKTFPQIKIITFESNVGGSKARNAGLIKSSSDFVAFLDSDDLWEPDHLKLGVDYLTKNHNDGVFTNFKLFSENKKKSNIINFDLESGVLEQKYLANYLLGVKRMDCRTSTFIMKRTALMSCSFDENLKKHQDWDLAIRFAGAFKLSFLNSCSVVIVQHDNTVRMSNKLNLESSEVFISKHRNILKPNTVYLFYLKMFYRAKRMNDSKSISTLREVLLRNSKRVSLWYRLLNYFVLRADKSIFILQKFKKILFNG